MAGSEVEPTTPGPDQVVDQMREATDRLREQAWMVAPLTSGLPEPPLAVDEAHAAPDGPVTG